MPLIPMVPFPGAHFDVLVQLEAGGLGRLEAVPPEYQYSTYRIGGDSCGV